MKLIEKNLNYITSMIQNGVYYTRLSRTGISNVEVYKYVHKPNKREDLSQNNFTSIQEIYVACQDKSLVAQDLFFSSFLQFLIEKEIIYIHTIIFPSKTYTRYSIKKEIDIFAFVYTFETRAFFSMTTALYLQGLSAYKSNNIFLSVEQSDKQHTFSADLSQASIDSAFVSGKSRYPSAIVSYEDYNIIIASPKHTDDVGVIIHNGYRMSSIDRALVELIINVQYVRNLDQLIEIFRPIKEKLNIDNILHILDRYNLIYPYYQAVGFILNQLGFDINQLKSFSDKISGYDFYIERGKDHYDYNSYWKMYY
jgi:hypothetical protein